MSNPWYVLLSVLISKRETDQRKQDLCLAALTFAFDTLKTGGSFVCKYYQGAEDKQLELRLKKLFERVYREKPEASRKESREGFFVGLRRRETPAREDIISTN